MQEKVCYINLDPSTKREFTNDSIDIRNQVINIIRNECEQFGFKNIETPALEYTEALGKFLPDVDRPSGGVFSFQDDDGQWLSMRYDLTAPLARYVAENYQFISKLMIFSRTKLNSGANLFRIKVLVDQKFNDVISIHLHTNTGYI